MTNKVGMISLGCPKNQVDGEVMLEKLNKSGFEISEKTFPVCCLFRSE